MSNLEEAFLPNSLVLFVNGKRIHFPSSSSPSSSSYTPIDPKTTLLQFLRSRGLTGTKLGCGEGGCGACTVMVSNYDFEHNQIRHLSVNACLTPLCSLDGCHVTTVEGIGGLKEGLHPVQQRVASLHGSQCGFCTPGIIMAIYAILRSNPNSTPHEIEENLDGNLCRCTGYRPILDAAKSLSNNKGGNGCCGGGNGCGDCPCKSNSADELVHTTTENAIHSHSAASEALSASGRSEPIFPPLLMRYKPIEKVITHNGVTWFQPTTLRSLLTIKKDHPETRLVVGNTEVGIEVHFKGCNYQYYANPSHIPELKTFSVESEGVRIGGAVTLREIKQRINDISSLVDGYKIRGLAAINAMLTWFASNHIRNVASIAGNIVTASPISDLNPLLCACNARLTLASTRGTREVLMVNFFKGYRKVDLEPDEVVVNVFIPFTRQWEYVIPHKQSKRREDDISIVTSGMRVNLEVKENKWVIGECALAFGGMAPYTVLASKTAKQLENQSFSRETFDDVYDGLFDELKLPANVPGGQPEFRNTLTICFLYRTFIKVALELRAMIVDSNLPAAPVVDPAEESAADGYLTTEKELTRGEQSYWKRQGGLQKTNPVPHTPDGDQNTKRAPVGEPIPHASSNLQCTGEALYTDDMPAPAGTYYSALVQSAKAHAKILGVDTSKAEQCPGFVAYFGAKDILGSNSCGPIVHDEEIFVTSEAKHVGAIIGLVVAESHEEARYAASQVVIQYEELPSIISIEEAIAQDSFFPDLLDLIDGDVDEKEKESDFVVSGKLNIGGQEHFYLETNACLVIPLENNQLEMFASTQCAHESQQIAAHVCNIPSSHVVCRVKRIGGGFGGKESRAAIFHAPVALAAYKLGKPVRINIERDVDMSTSGQRHAFSASYKAGCTKDGKLKFLDVQLFSNAGFSYDLSIPVMGRALSHIDGPYKWEAFRGYGRLCKTNQPSHTAYRGFGAPQGMFVVETVIEHLSKASGIDSLKIRESNFYKNGDETPFGMKIEDYNVADALSQVIESSNYHQRKAEIEKFNASNKWKKRGIFVLPTKYGLNYTAKFMNQGGALVNIYADGQVLISHGGMEMGQGIHTKMIQIVARALRIPHTKVFVSETATNVVPNGIATAGSMGTDIYGMALLNACEQLNERLDPIREANPSFDWEKLIDYAFFNRVNLSAQGFYRVPSDRCGYDFSIKVKKHNSERGQPYNYFTQGAACTEVEIDCLTGDNKLVRVDIVMDVGQSINPALDIGQIEGAFVQGYGWSTMEELIWGDSQHTWVKPGNLFTRGPGFYKIPSFNDVPTDFRVSLMDRCNKRAVHSSKGIGEPPFFLSCSGVFAIRNAISAFRQELGLNEYFTLNIPATSERIRMSIPDCFSTRITKDNNFQAKGSW